MPEQNTIIGKKGAGKTLTKKMKKIREKSINEKILKIIDENNQKNKTNKKVAKPPQDVEI